MSIENAMPDGELPRAPQRVASLGCGPTRTTPDELSTRRAREQDMLREMGALLRRQHLMAQEFEHRLVNSLQLVVSLLSMQSRAAATAESAAQLTIAAGRVAALGRVHRRLHLLDHQSTVEFKQYLQDLCADLSGLLFTAEAGRAVVVAGTDVKLPTALGIPLGFVVNELITNSIKYAQGDITVRIEVSPTAHLLSVTDDGPGLPAEFDPTRSTGLGMKIVRSLVQQIGGALEFGPGEAGRGARVTVAFAPHVEDRGRSLAAGPLAAP
jgi:two-component system, sensor histidine kinase PdtaS